MKQLPVLFLVVVVPLVRAGEVCHDQAWPSATTNWSQPCVLPKHDPALGALQSVTVLLRATATVSAQFENLDAFSSPVRLTCSARSTLQRPDASTIVAAEPRVEGVFNLLAFDGVVDFAGSSGFSVAPTTAGRSEAVILTSPGDLALFTASAPGESIALQVTAQGGGGAAGPGNLVGVFTTISGAEVSVCYGYAQTRQQASLALTTTNWSGSATFAKHDPALGPLRAVRILTRATLVGSSAVELPSPALSLVTEELAVLASVRRPDTSPIAAVTPAQAYLDLLQPFDGTLDFRGPSGVTHPVVTVASAERVALTSPADLALFTASVPGDTIQLGVACQGLSTATGPGPLVVVLSTAAGVELDLRYDRGAPVAAVCFGDGSAAPCPCGNASLPGDDAGCLNSLGLAGTLRGSGFAEIGADTLVLTASNLPATAPVLFIQGTSAIAVPFGDGLRCAGGTVARLGTVAASGGVAAYPPPGGSVSGAGLATAGSTLVYQAWYRNSAPFCTASTFNLTNALSIAW
ncbi:MAG: choice-of-anchor E domain-containing protein [Planctomycetes bacterium]|nr:choice-of-anchor E domain-containing protein [Planctomycetota bacterium]